MTVLVVADHSGPSESSLFGQNLHLYHSMTVPSFLLHAHWQAGAAVLDNNLYELDTHRCLTVGQLCSDLHVAGPNDFKRSEQSG